MKTRNEKKASREQNAHAARSRAPAGAATHALGGRASSTHTFVRPSRAVTRTSACDPGGGAAAGIWARPAAPHTPRTGPACDLIWAIAAGVPHPHACTRAATFRLRSLAGGTHHRRRPRFSSAPRRRHHSTRRIHPALGTRRGMCPGPPRPRALHRPSPGRPPASSRPPPRASRARTRQGSSIAWPVRDQRSACSHAPLAHPQPCVRRSLATTRDVPRSSHVKRNERREQYNSRPA